MDRRIKKSRKAIVDAFIALLQKKDYQKIRVNEILERADVGRATFYAHFESKEILLEEYSLTLFHHIFDEQIQYDSLEELLLHLFQHIAADNVLQKLLVQEQTYFIREFRHHLEEFLWPVVEEKWIRLENRFPKSFLMQQLVASILATLQWWFPLQQAYSAEEVSAIYRQYLHQFVV